MRSHNLIGAVSSSIIVLSILLAACEPVYDETQNTEPPEPTPTPQVVEFPEEGVTVILPWQPSQEEELEIVKLDVNKYDSRLGDQCGWIRTVINFEVIDTHEEPVDTFDPPMTLTVTFTITDALEAGGRENLILGFFDEELEYWKPIENGETVIDGETQTGTVHVTDWGDRHGCWCRR
jgi:hypothetical protein